MRNFHLGLAALAIAAVPAQAHAQAVDERAFGVLAKLADSYWAGDDGTATHIEWETPGQLLIQSTAGNASLRVFGYMLDQGRLVSREEGRPDALPVKVTDTGFEVTSAQGAFLNACRLDAGGQQLSCEAADDTGARHPYLRRRVDKPAFDAVLAKARADFEARQGAAPQR